MIIFKSTMLSVHSISELVARSNSSLFFYLLFVALRTLVFNFKFEMVMVLRNTPILSLSSQKNFFSSSFLVKFVSLFVLFSIYLCMLVAMHKLVCENASVFVHQINRMSEIYISVAKSTETRLNSVMHNYFSLWFQRDNSFFISTHSLTHIH